MLVFTNRQLTTNLDNEKAFTKAYTPFSDALNCALVSSNAIDNSRWKVTNHSINLTDQAALAELRKSFSGAQPILVYLHGNNNSPDTCFTRCQALEAEYGVSVIAYSWTSEGYQPNGDDLSGIDNGKVNDDLDEDNFSKVSKNKLSEGWIQRKARRYAQAKTNAQHSAASLARFLRLVAAARLSTMKMPFSIAAHSLGCHFVHYAITQEGAAESFAAAQNIILMAGCTGSAKHAAWVSQINPVQRVYVTYTKADSVLAAAFIVDGDTKLGTDPGTDRVKGVKYRYIDFEGAAKMNFGAHRYFVADPAKTLSKQATLLFKRIFTSEPDISTADSSLKVVYPVGCTPDMSVCYMGNS